MVMFARQAAAEASQSIGRPVSPREVTALFYSGVLPDKYGPIVGGRRLISPEGLAAIVSALSRYPLRSRKGAKK